jgi:hypothetical protein
MGRRQGFEGHDLSAVSGVAQLVDKLPGIGADIEDKVDVLLSKQSAERMVGGKCPGRAHHLVSVSLSQPSSKSSQHSIPLTTLTGHPKLRYLPSGVGVILCKSSTEPDHFT